ncbi:MAG: N-acetylmuramidase family protein [Candidatus Thiodiazotropha taylori]|nr:N-acetylmuramidase family protein [Candidatus Thiodiazotropha taylori]
MTLQELIRDSHVQGIILHPEDDKSVWLSDLDRFLSGDTSLTRNSAGEAGIRAVQRLLVFLGYSTSSNGAFLIDGDFGRGTNRAVAQFQVENRLSRSIKRHHLCYPCRWNTAKSLITTIPDARLTPATLEMLLVTAIRRIESGHIMTGHFDTAIFHLNAVDRRQGLDCRAILSRYGDIAIEVSQKIYEEFSKLVRPEWILAIIRQETAGVIRPRFEQHYLSKLNDAHPGEDLEELRMQSMSMGLGQIMGANYKRVGAVTATELFTAPVARQVEFVARFLRLKEDVVKKTNPNKDDFHRLAKYYNGPKYAAHHYHEKLARWHREFRLLMN